MLCPNCGQIEKDDSVFCGKCGKKIPRCPTCGMVLTERAPFCINDGTRIPDDILKLIPEKEKSGIKADMRQAGAGGGKAAEKTAEPVSEKAAETAAYKASEAAAVKRAPEAAVKRALPENKPAEAKAEQSKPDNRINFCIKCGRPCNFGETLCEACKAAGEVQPPTKKELKMMKKQGKKKKSKLPLILVLLLLIIILAAAAAVFAMREGYIATPDFLSSVPFLSGETTEGEADAEDASQEDEKDKAEDDDVADEEEADEDENAAEEPEAEEEDDEEQEEESDEPVRASDNGTADKIPVEGFDNAISSSQLADEGDISYSPLNVLDGDKTTAWCEGISGTGEGEWIEVQSDYVETIHKIGILNGYRADADLYQKNGKVVTALLSFSDGTSQTVKFDTRDNDGYNYFNVGTKETSYVRITLLSCDAGTEYEDTCISEIKIY